LVLDQTIGVIYYTDNRLEGTIYTEAQKHILASGLPITSSSLKPIDFGENEVVVGDRSYPTMVKQIISCLRRSKADYTFFCEHDVLYHRSHFKFVPTRDDIFYYNDNCWRWLYGADKAIRHDRMLSLSNLCVNREFALDHYQRRLAYIEANGFDKIVSKEPSWARTMGYEPGQKKKKRGGFSDDDYETWTSKYPNIDIRHGKTFSPPKTRLLDFKHPPKWFKEVPIEWISGWDLKEIFSL
jgi:hypothetical protein